MNDWEDQRTFAHRPGAPAPCQARVRVLRADGTDHCTRPARHEHFAFTTGSRLELCTQHFEMILRYERRGSPGDLVKHWNGT